MIAAIRTSSGPYAVGVFSNQNQLLSANENLELPQQRKSISELFHEALSDAGAKISQLREIIVDLGPGGLSSCRVGISFANAVAFGTGVKLSGVSALDLQEIEAMDYAPNKTILSLRPALGQRAFWRIYSLDKQVEFGHGTVDEGIERAISNIDDTVVVGPLSRLQLNIPLGRNVSLLDMPAPALDTFLRAPRRGAQMHKGLQVSEPITTIEGLTIG